MTRNDWIWVAIRIFGIYLIVLAIVEIPNVISSGVMTYHYWGLRGMEPVSLPDSSAIISDLDRMSTRVFANMAVTQGTALVHSIVRIILFGMIGCYFVTNGKLLFQLVGRPNGITSESDEVPNELR